MEDDTVESQGFAEVGSSGEEILPLGDKGGASGGFGIQERSSATASPA
jgi:hypothetical protein